MSDAMPDAKSQPLVAAPILAKIAAQLRSEQFAHCASADVAKALAAYVPLADWDAFAASWAALGPDTFMADGGRYRRRRYAVFAAADQGPITREAHQPHYQGREYNALNGGIERWFDPVEPAVAEGATCTAVLRFCRDAFAAAAPSPRPWHIEMHQFRIEAKPGTAGKPTPEGMHRDGVDYVLVMMIKRTNIQRGETIMADAAQRPRGRFTLTEPMESVLLDDHHVFHGVTPVEAIDPEQPAYRDVLVVTFRRA
jgi:hypothetical protein